VSDTPPLAAPSEATLTGTFPVFAASLASAGIGASGALLAMGVGHSVSWRFDVAAVLASSLIQGLTGWIASSLGVAVVVALLAPSPINTIATLAVPLLIGAVAVLRRDLFEPIDERRARFLSAIAIAGAAIGAPAALVLAAGDASWLPTAMAIWLGTMTGLLIGVPLLVSLQRTLSPRAWIATSLVGSAFVGLAATMPAVATLPQTPVLVAMGSAVFLAILLAMRALGLPAMVMLFMAALLAACVMIANANQFQAAMAAAAFVVAALNAHRARLNRIEAEQRVTQGLFDAMMRFLPVGLFRADVEGRVRYANPMFRTLTGLSPDALEGWRDTVHPEDRKRIDQAWDRFLRGETAFDEVFRVEPLGNLRWIQVRVSPEYHSGNVAGYIGTLSDITTQRISEQARQRTEAHSRAILDSAVDAIITIDEHGTIRTFNGAAQRMFGFAREEVIGRNISLLMPPRHAEHHDGYLKRYLSTGEGHIIGIGRELDARRSDGTEFPVYLAVSEVMVDGVRNFTGMMRDISRERAADEEIRRQHEQLSVTMQNAPMGIATYRFGTGDSLTERFSSANRAFLSLTGYEEADLLGRCLQDLVHPDDRGELSRLTEDARRGRRTQFACRLRLRRADGQEITVSTHNAITHDADGRPDLVIVQAEDLTAEIQASEAERAHREELTHVARLSTLGEMTAGIAHEINQPLTAITMYAQSGMRLLDADNPNPPRLREALEKLCAQSLRAGAVIDRIQRLVRHREGVREPVAMNELVADILRLAESDARVNGMQLELELADDLPLVRADPIQIQQVLLNLVRNAIDAMESIGCRNGRTLVIRTVKDHHGVGVSVIDAGTGVAADFAPLLFTPFATTKPTGMGMGLSICRSIIEDHGGHLGYVNNSEHGATFYFQLPGELSDEE